jgi:transcriptional regulator with XRE-family HTH domain
MNPSDTDSFALRLRQLIQVLRIKDIEFAQQGGITKQTLSTYLKGRSEPSRATMANWVKTFNIDGTWLLTGENEMFRGETSQGQLSIPAEETSTDLSPVQREMLTYKRLQSELGMPNERIAEGIEAIVMGKCVAGKKSLYGVAEEAGVGVGSSKVQEDGAEFGKNNQ